MFILYWNVANYFKDFLDNGEKILYKISEMIDINNDSSFNYSIQDAIW